MSQAWFYKWRHGDASPRHARREQLKVAIRRWFAHGGDGQLSEDERAELARLRRENAELAMERVL